MAKLDILKYPDPRLKQQCIEVNQFNSELHQLLDDMTETMYQEGGIGLAAPQVGVLQQVVVIDVSDNRSKSRDFVNPKILTAEGSVSSEEGCLSIPSYRDVIKRNQKVVISAQDRNGKPFELEADELLAICLQHEIDHLNGILFVDRLSRLKREMFKRWLKKQAEQNE